MDKKSLHTKIPHPQTHTKSVNCLKCFGLTQKKNYIAKNNNNKNQSKFQPHHFRTTVTDILNKLFNNVK